MNTELFIESLQIMGKGMLGIFAVTAVIILVISLLNLTTKPKDKDKKNDDV